jgi:hypothetical protein
VESGQRAERGQNPMGLPQCNDLPKLKPCLVRVYIGLMYGYISHIIPLFFFFLSSEFLSLLVIMCIVVHVCMCVSYVSRVSCCLA